MPTKMKTSHSTAAPSAMFGKCGIDWASDSVSKKGRADMVDAPLQNAEAGAGGGNKQRRRPAGGGREVPPGEEGRRHPGEGDPQRDDHDDRQPGSAVDRWHEPPRAAALAGDGVGRKGHGKA